MLTLEPTVVRVTVLGKVVAQGGATPEGARVEFVLDLTMQAEAVVQAGADGTFVADVPPGSYTLRASHPLFVTASRTLPQPLVPGPIVDLSADPISLALNPATLTGRVLGEVDDGSAPTPKSQVLVTLDTGETSTTDAQGQYVFMGLAGGPRQVRFAVADFTEASRAVTLSPGQNATLPDVTLALRRGVIQGTVTLNDLQPAQDVTVALTGAAAYATVAVADPAQPGLGRFRIDRVPNGTYEVTASKNRYSRAVQSSVQVTDSMPVATIGPLALSLLVGEFRIDDGDAANAEGFTRRPQVTLELNAFAGASFWRASEDPADAGVWLPFTGLNQPFALVPTQGRHTVTAQYQRTGVASPAFTSSITLDSLGPTNGAVELNGGELFTNNPLSVSLRLTATDPAGPGIDVSGLGSVRLSLSPATVSTDAGAVLTSNPQPYARDLSFPLPQPQTDGVVTVYSQFIDNAGNPSAVVPASITLDRQPPQNVTLGIRDGAQATSPGFTNSALVQLDHAASLAAEPTGGYVLFKVSNSSAALDQVPWQQLVPTSSWFLEPTGAPLKTVFARFRDAAGNQTNVVQAQVTYDDTPPSPVSLVLLSGSPTNDAGVTLRLAATDTNGLSPTAAVTVAEDPLFSRDVMGPMAMPGSSQLVYRLAETQGSHQVLVRYTDRAGNSASASVTVVLDTVAPTGAQLQVGSGAAVQTGANFPITFVGAPGDVTLMAVSASALSCGSAGYQAFAPTSVLPIGEGAQQVFACLKDAAGNFAPYGPVNVTVDVTPPVAGSIATLSTAGVPVSITNSAALVVRFTGLSDPTAGIDAVRVSTDSAFAGVPFAPATPSSGTFDYPFVIPPGDGTRTLYAQVRDRAGLISNTVQTTVTLDTQAPVWTQFTAAPAVVSGASTSLTLGAVDNIDSSAQLQATLALTATGCATATGFTGLSGFSWAGLVDGVNTAFLCLRDRAGNAPAVPPQIQARRIVAPPSAANLLPNAPIPLASGALLSWTDTNPYTERIMVDAALDSSFTQSLRTYEGARGSCGLNAEVAPASIARVGLQPGELPLTNLRNWYFRLRSVNCAGVSSANVIVPGSVLPNLAATPTDQAFARGRLVADGLDLWQHAPFPSYGNRIELMRHCRVGVSDCRNESSWSTLAVTVYPQPVSAPTRPAALFPTDTHWFLTDVVNEGGGTRMVFAACDRTKNCALAQNWVAGARPTTAFGPPGVNVAGAANSVALGVFYSRRDPFLGNAPYLAMARCPRARDCSDPNSWSEVLTPIRVDPNEPLTVVGSDNQFFIGAVSEGPFGGVSARLPSAAGQPMLIKCENLCSAVTAPPDGSCNGTNCGCDGYRCGDFRFSRFAAPVGAETLTASTPTVISSNGQKTAAWFERRCVGTACTDAVRTSTCLSTDCLYGMDYAQAGVLAQWPGTAGAAKGRFSLTASGTREQGETLRAHWMDGTTGFGWLASCTTATLSPCFSTAARVQLSDDETIIAAVAVGKDSYFLGQRQLGEASLWQPIIPTPSQFVVGPRPGALEVSWAPYEATSTSLLQYSQPDGGSPVTVPLADPFSTNFTIPATSPRSMTLRYTNINGVSEGSTWTTTPFVAVPGAAGDAWTLPAISLATPGLATSNLNGSVYAAYGSAGGVRLGRCDSSGDCRVAANWSWALIDTGTGFGAVQLSVDYPREHHFGPRATAVARAYSTPRMFLTALNAGALYLYGCVLTTPTACATPAAFTRVRLDQAPLPAVAPGALPSLRAVGDRVMVTESTTTNTVVVRFCDGAQYPQQTCNGSYPSPPPTAQTNLPLSHCFSAANWQSVTLSSSHQAATNGLVGASPASPGSAPQATGEPHPVRGFTVIQPRDADGFLYWSCNFGTGDSGCAPAAKKNCALLSNWQPVIVRTGGPARHVDLVSSDGDYFPTRGMSEQAAGVYVSFWDPNASGWGVAQCKFEPNPLYDAAWVCTSFVNMSTPDSVAWSATTVLRDVPGVPASSTLRVVGGDLIATFTMTDRAFVARCAGGHDCMLRSAWNSYALPQVFNSISSRSTMAGGLTGDLILAFPERDAGVTLLGGGRFTPQ